MRGYHKKYGWLHSAAHGADALDELVLCGECTKEICLDIMESIKQLLHKQKYMLCHEEDERISVVINSIYSKKLISNDELINWFYKLIPFYVTSRDYESFVSKLNSINFVRSLYFQSIRFNYDEEITEKLLEVQERVNSIDKNVSII